MKTRLFRPVLTECEARLTPAASPAQILADLNIVQADSAILRSVYNDPSQVTAKGNDQVGHAFMSVIADQSAAAVADLTPFVADLQSQIAANPALSGLLGAYVGQVQAAIVTADLDTGYTQFFQQVINAAAEQHQALAAAIAASSPSPTNSTTPSSTTPAGSQQATVNPNGTITVNGANGPITLPNPSTSTSTGTTTGTSTGSTGTTPTSENTSGSGTTTTTPPTTSTGTTQTGATSSVSTGGTGTTSASGTGGNTTTG